MDIFIGSLPFKMKENQLKELFEKFGEVTSATIVINKATRQNKGFGFVQMPDENAAMKAIQTLNDTEVLGRLIKVSKSEKKEVVVKDTRPRKPHFRTFKKLKQEKVDSEKGMSFKGEKKNKRF